MSVSSTVKRDLAELHATREQLVDSMNRSGIHVDHRPEVVARRVAQQRADDRAAEQRETARVFADARAQGHLGTPTYKVAEFMPGRSR